MSRAFILLLAAAALACAADEKKVKTAGGTATVKETSKGKGTVTMAGKTSQYEAGKIPADWPKDVPLPKDAKPVMALKSADGPSLTIMTTEATPTLVAFYEKELAANGWKLDTKRVFGGDAKLAAAKGKQTTSLTVLDRGKERQITINVTTP